MPRNIELVSKLFGSKNPLPSIELADNALKLGGIEANLYALKSELNGEVDIVLGNIDDLIAELEEHKNDDVRHLTQPQIDKINSAIDSVEALRIANRAINDAKSSIIATAVQSATAQSEDYTDGEVDNLRADLEKKIGNLNLPTEKDPETGEPVDKTLSDTLESSPQNLINPEYFYRFKNMIENSSFEVFDGNTMIPLGWDNGKVSADASMFETYSLKLTTGQTAKQTSSFQADMDWIRNNDYNTKDVVLCFYHKFDPVRVRVYDVVNEEYLTLTLIKQDLTEEESTTSIIFDTSANWSQYRCMVKFTPKASTRKVRIEFTCESGRNGACYIDAPMLEPYLSGEYPSIYKNGRYSVSAYQILNPPPADVDRFTALEHFNVANSQYDSKGNITYQELLRSDGSLAIRRQASNPDENGYYKTFVETFYKKDGSVNYIDTYSYTYSSSGAILSKSKTTTEEVG